MAARMPGRGETGSGHMTAAEPVDAVTLTPLDRWDTQFGDRAGLSKAGSLFASFLWDVALFDPTVYAMSLVEATLLDPNQRTLMELAGRAIGGIERPREATGVFVGVSNTGDRWGDGSREGEGEGEGEREGGSGPRNPH